MRTQYSHIRYKGHLIMFKVIFYFIIPQVETLEERLQVFEEIGKNRMGCLQRKAFIWEAHLFLSSNRMFCRVVERRGSSGKNVNIYYLLSSRQCTYK